MHVRTGVARVCVCVCVDFCLFLCLRVSVSTGFASLCVSVLLNGSQVPTCVRRNFSVISYIPETPGSRFCNGDDDVSFQIKIILLFFEHTHACRSLSTVSSLHAPLSFGQFHRLHACLTPTSTSGLEVLTTSANRSHSLSPRVNSQR